MLKILSGQHKRRSLKTLPSAQVRPILARIKKSVFDILRPRMAGADFLDIYAGSGAVGIEALSQGAAFAVFIDQDARCVRIIKENLAMLELENNSKVFRLSATGDLSAVPGPFDLIFLGPPYKDAEKNMLALVKPTLENIIKYKLLKPEGLVIAQHHKREPLDTLPPSWILKREEKYGDTLVSFLQIA